MRAKPKIYLETTLFNYYFDTDRDAHADTVRLFKAIAAGEYEAYTSDTVVNELLEAPEKKRDAMVALIEEYGIEILHFKEDAEKLTDTYTAEGIVPLKYRTDGIHIALATVNNLDFIVSLNFRHIVNVRTIERAHAANILRGYRPIKIVSPMEMIEHENA